eukprot:scaffold54742_cov47-Prasinocladus_malaysianus.AAC.1
MAAVVCVQQQQLIHGQEGAGAGVHHRVAVGAIGGVAVGAKVAVADNVQVDGKGQQRQTTHQEAIDKAIHDSLPGEDAVLDWGPHHHVWRAVIQGNTNSRAGSSGRVDVQNGDGTQGEDWEAIAVQNVGQGNEQDNRLGNVPTQ